MLPTGFACNSSSQVRDTTDGITGEASAWLPADWLFSDDGGVAILCCWALEAAEWMDWTCSLCRGNIG
jgi:hypothetical protein